MNVGAIVARFPARLVLAAPLLFWLAACAPRLQPLLPDVTMPAIEDHRLVMADGVGLPLRRWLPQGKPRAIVLALHGFNDYSSAFEEPALAWAKAGIATYAYDQRGFGQTPQRGIWPGDERLIEDARTAAVLLAARYPGRPFYLLGESMGGAVLMASAVAPGAPRADGLILAAPAVWGRESQGPLQSLGLWLTAHTMPWLTATGEGFAIVPSDNIEMLRKLSLDPLVIKETRMDAVYGLVGLMDKAYDAAPDLGGPCLVLYGAHEEVIPPRAALAMLRRLPKAGNPKPAVRLVLYPNGYHMLLRDLQAAVVVADVLAFIADPAAPLPSGAEGLAATVVEGDDHSFAAVAGARP